MRTSNHPLPVFAHPPSKATFVASFLGAVVPLLVQGLS